MANYTTNLSLKKPLQSENYNVEDFNENFEIIDKKIVTTEALTNFISDFFTSGLASLTDESRNFGISYNDNMSININSGVAYSNGKRIVYEPSRWPNPDINIAPVTDGSADYVLIFAINNQDGEFGEGNAYGIPVGFTGIMTYRSKSVSTIPLVVPLYRITIAPATTKITGDLTTDLRTQMIINNEVYS